MENIQRLTVDFIPACCIDQEGKPATFEGKLIIALPLLQEKLDLLDKLGAMEFLSSAIDFQNGTFDATKIDIPKVAKNLLNISTFNKALVFVSPFIKEVKLTKKDTGKVYTQVAELMSYPECLPIVAEYTREMLVGKFSGLSFMQGKP